MTTIIGSEEPGNPTSGGGQPRPRSKLSIAVAKAAAELEASKKKEKQSETAAAADASSAISASVSSEVADQPTDDVTPSSNNNNDIEAAAVPTNITDSDSNADDKPSSHIEEVEFDAEIIAAADVPWWKRRLAKIILILVSVLAIGLGVGLGVAFSRQPPTSTAPSSTATEGEAPTSTGPTSTATEEEGAPAASSGSSSTLLGYCNESPPSTGDSKDIIVSYKYTMITDGSANASTVASRMEEQIHDVVMIEKCTINTPERKLQAPPSGEVSNDVLFIGFESSPADVVTSDSCPDSTNVPEGKVCSVVEGGITAVVPSDTNDAKVRQNMSHFLQKVLSNDDIANDVGATDIAYVPNDTVTEVVGEDASVEAVSTGTDDVTPTTSPFQSSSELSLAPSTSSALSAQPSQGPSISTQPPSQMPTESASTSKGSVTSCSEYFATRDELKAAVDTYVSSGCNEGANVCPNITSKYGWPMNSWCVGNVTDMSELFSGMSTFNEDVSSWDVSQVQDMRSMFYDASSFNQDISSWDVSQVQDMSLMFEGASSFNGDLSLWNVSQVQEMNGMFRGASSFNGDVSLWDVSKVQDMSYMFAGASSFNGDISSWNVSRVQNMNYMFRSAKSFNADISSWDVSQVQDMSLMFYKASSFNGDLSSWDVSQVQDMRFMFSGVASSFNGDLSLWDVSQVKDMSRMFFYASSFNGDLSSWDISQVQDMSYMFADTSSFNRDVSLWNISQVGNMDGMFYKASSFNQNLCAWADKNFPYSKALSIFLYSGCTYQSSPLGQGGPFCASDCN